MCAFSHSCCRVGTLLLARSSVLRTLRLLLRDISSYVIVRMLDIEYWFCIPVLVGVVHDVLVHLAEVCTKSLAINCIVFPCLHSTREDSTSV